MTNVDVGQTLQEERRIDRVKGCFIVAQWLANAAGKDKIQGEEMKQKGLLVKQDKNSTDLQCTNNGCLLLVYKILFKI